VGLAIEDVVELDSVPIELGRLLLPVVLGSAGRISKMLFSLVAAVDQKTAAAPIAAEKFAATEHSVARRVDSAVTAMVVRAKNS